MGELPSTATELPPAHAGEPLATKTRTRITRTRTRSHATAMVPPAMNTVLHPADMAHPWTATEPQRLSMVPPLPITERPATRLRWRPTNQWSPMLLLPSVTRPPQLTQPPPPLMIMPPPAQVMELLAMVTEPQARVTVPQVLDTELPALGMELQTAPAEGPSVTKIRTRTKTRPLVMKTATGPPPMIPPPTKL